MHLSDLLHITRKTRQVTLMDLVQSTGLSYGMVYRVMNGRIKKPSPDMLKKLSVPLRLDYDYLLQRAGYKLSDQKETHSKTDSRAIPVLSLNYLRKMFPFRENITSGLSDDHVYISGQEKNVFAVHVDDSFAVNPYFKCGDTLVCYPSETYQDGEIVLVLCVDDDKIRLGCYRSVHGATYVDLLNIQNGFKRVNLSEYLTTPIVSKVGFTKLK